MKKRILYLCSGRSFRSDRLPRKLAEVANTWRRMGHDVLQISGGDLDAEPADVSSLESYSAGGRPWYDRVALLQPAVHSVSELRDIQHDVALVKHLDSICRDYQPDLIVERSCRLHSAGLVAARRLGISYVLEWKDNIASYRYSLFRNRALRLECRKNRDADYVVTESDVIRNDLINEGIDGGKILVAHNAVDVSQFRQDGQQRINTRCALGIDKDTVLVGYLGSYAWYQDSVRLVLATQHIRQTCPELNLRVLMVGAGKEYAATRARAEKLGLLENAVVIRPRVPKEEVPSILAALDIAVLPGSTNIICPIKVQEYMACALPSVVPDFACNREVIEHERTGMLFRPRDEQALALCLVHLAGDASKRHAIGRRAREESVKRFSWEATWGAALEHVLRADSTDTRQ